MPARAYKRKRRYSYKSYKRSKKIKSLKNFFRLVTLSLTGFFLFGIAFYLYTLTINLKKPFANASNGIDYSIEYYDSTKPFNILFVGLNDKTDIHSEITGLYIYHINPVDKYSVLMELTLDNNINYGKGLGEGPLKKLYSAGNFGTDKDGLNLVTRFIRNSFAIPIDSYVIYDVETSKKLDENNLNFSKEKLSNSIKYSYFLKISSLFDLSRNYILSDLGSVEAIKLISDTKSFSEDYTYLKLPKDIYTNTEMFDEIWMNNVTYSDIKKERVSVTILNSTNQSGLAAWASRTVSNVGSVIKDIGNEPIERDENVIYTELKDSKTLNYLKHFHNIEKVLDSKEYKNDPFLAKRSDILLILGKQAVSDYN